MALSPNELFEEIKFEGDAYGKVVQSIGEFMGLLGDQILTWRLEIWRTTFHKVFKLLLLCVSLDYRWF